MNSSVSIGEAEPSLREIVTRYLSKLPPPQFSPSLELRASGIAGHGIFATEPIAEGSVLVVEHGPIVDHRTIIAINAFGYECELCVGWGLYSLHAPTSPGHEGGYINHSCSPNAGLTDIRTFSAIRDIEVGEEITCDYGTFETEAGWSMTCHCGSANCRATIRATDHRLQSLKAHLFRYFAPYLRDPSLTKRLRDEYLPLSIDADGLDDPAQRAHDEGVDELLTKWDGLRGVRIS